MTPMTPAPHRLPPDDPLGERKSGLAGTAIDRSRPLSFRLNGYPIPGFAGDTVLSAALAAGLDTVGKRAGHPLALGHRFAPPVAPARLAHDPRHALPMARAPAADGQDFVTLPPGPAFFPLAARAGALFGRPPHSLALGLDTGQSLTGPWLDIPPSATHSADLIVIGGGLAGMSAAVTAARKGARVLIAERRPYLGGDAVLFGRVENEEGPEEAIARLAAEIAGHENIALFLSAEAFALDGSRVKLHVAGADKGEILAAEAPRIVLATGAVERLPLFPGNRLPGVAGTAEAFHLASAYGVWPGRSAAFAPVSNAGYRLAMLAAGAGLSVQRILDARPRPQSRFLEFCKAYAITMAGGSIVTAAAPAPGRGKGLLVGNAVILGDHMREETPLGVDRLVVCGGWQPDLTLWHMGGGESAWRPAEGRILAGAGPKGLALAGAAGGWRSTRACLESGRDAVDLLFSRARKPVRETVIDTAFDTPDGPLPIAPRSAGNPAPCYLDDGPSLTLRPAPPPEGFLARLGLRRPARDWQLTEHPRALSIGDVCAGVVLGAMPPAIAGLIARERATSAGDLIEGARVPDRAPAPAAPPLVPPYLAGRFGPGAKVWTVAPGEPRRLEPGSLIHANAETTDPARAVGVVLAQPPAGAALALVGALAAPGAVLVLRERSRAVPVRLLAPFEN